LGVESLQHQNGCLSPRCKSSDHRRTDTKDDQSQVPKYGSKSADNERSNEKLPSLEKLHNIGPLKADKQSLIPDEGIMQLTKLKCLNIQGNSCVTNAALKDLTNLTELGLVHETSMPESGLSFDDYTRE